MGTFTVDCELQELSGNRPPAKIIHMKIEVGSKYTWLPEKVLRTAGVKVAKKGIAFVLANGAITTRDMGYAYLRSGEFETVDEIVFARPDDLRLLGARTLEGFAARVDSRTKRLIATGPLPVASATSVSRCPSTRALFLWRAVPSVAQSREKNTIGVMGTTSLKRQTGCR